MNDWLPRFALALEEHWGWLMSFSAADIEMLYPDEFQRLAALRDSIISLAQHIKTEQGSLLAEPEGEARTSRYSELWDHEQKQQKLIDAHRQTAEEIAKDLNSAIRRALRSVGKRRSLRLKRDDCGWRRRRSRDRTVHWPQWEIHPTDEKYDEYLWVKFELDCGKFRDHRDRSGGIDDVPEYIPRHARDIISYLFAKLVIARGKPADRIVHTYWQLKTRELDLAGLARKFLTRKQDESKCAYCGRASTDLKVSQLVHGGPIGVNNLVYACGECLRSRGDRELIEWWGDVMEKRHGALPRIYAGLYLWMVFEFRESAFRLDEECRSLTDLWTPT